MSLKNEINNWTRAAKAGEPVWLGDVRSRFAASPDTQRLVFRLTLLDGSVRDFQHFVPLWDSSAERSFVREYLCACVYNMLSALSGRSLCIYLDMRFEALAELCRELPQIFQLERKGRTGYGKVINIADRLCAAFGGKPFSFQFEDIHGYWPLPKSPRSREQADLGAFLRRVTGQVSSGLYCGVDVGGTDIKLAAARDGELLCTGIYDWDPSRFPNAEDLIQPILLLVRLLRAAAREGVAPPAALLENGALADIERYVQAAEAEGALPACQAIGLSFPDLVIRGHILGGETPKTQGMRQSHPEDYDREFAKLSGLRSRLKRHCVPGGTVRILNDGSMAAFSSAVELACAGSGEIQDGVLAHSLGTDLGTGWLRSDGSATELPLETYDFLLDLGSWPQRRYMAEDLRSVRNENSGLPGARRYLGQAAAFRLAWELESKLLEDFSQWHGDLLTLRQKPEDMRKPCLEHLMDRARLGDAAAQEVFRRIGCHLGQIGREMDFLLRPELNSRFLYGRFVKSRACFALLQEGCLRVMPGLKLIAADEDLAFSPLMKALARRAPGSVAQYGQTVGAIYFAASAATGGQG